MVNLNLNVQQSFRLIVKTTCGRSLKVNQTRVETAIQVNENFKILVLQDRSNNNDHDARDDA